jgi:hypothetical protein
VARSYSSLSKNPAGERVHIKTSPFKSFVNTEYGACHATTRLSQGRSKPSPSHNRPPAGESEICDCKGRKNKQAPKEVKTSQKSIHHRIPESQPFLIFPLAIPHSFRFHSSSIMQLAQSRKQLSTLFGYSTPHEPIILSLVRVVQRFDAVIAPLYSYGVARVIP